MPLISALLHCSCPLQVPADARRSVLVDLLTVYGEGGKAIVFTQVGARVQHSGHRQSRLYCAYWWAAGVPRAG